MTWERSADQSSELTTNDGVGWSATFLPIRGTLAGSADTSIPDPYQPKLLRATASSVMRFDGTVACLTDLGALPAVNSSEGTESTNADGSLGLRNTALSILYRLPLQYMRSFGRIGK